MHTICEKSSGVYCQTHHYGRRQIMPHKVQFHYHIKVYYILKDTSG